jgi:serine/threonine-protein kinase RsbW
MLPKMPKGSSIVLKSCFSAVEPLCRRILADLEAQNYSKDDVFAVHLGLEEAFINAVKHGNKGKPDKKVIINYSVSPKAAEIFVTDEGDGFDPEDVPDPRRGDNIFKDGGRGLFLIKAYMDKVEFNKPGNCIRMVKYNSGAHIREGSRFADAQKKRLEKPGNEKKKSRIKPGKPIKI